MTPATVTMETNASRAPPATTTTTTRHRTERLRIDNVLATQPEAGPVIPDGGYGWITLIAAFYIKNIISGLPIMYGLLLMFATIETGTASACEYSLWTNATATTALLYTAVQTLSDPLCLLLIKNSRWPRFVGLVGICLICASILMIWLSVAEGFARITLLVFSGIFAGFGSSMVLNQINVSIAQFFRLKLPTVEAILRAAEYSGIIFTAALIDKHMSVYGVPHSIIWYHLLVLTSALMVLLLRKPAYLKNQQVYRIVGPGQHADEDEEDIFSKTTELQSPHTSLPTIPEHDIPSTTNQPQQNWETFDEERDENELPTPRELFTEGQINNNVTYAFENVDHIITHGNTDDMTNIFLPVARNGNSYTHLKTVTFYSNCLLHIMLTTSWFVFLTTFPSYLYYSIPSLRKESIGRFVSYVFIACLFEAVLIGFWRFPKANRKFPIALMLWLSATGNFLISDWKREIFIMVGGILVTTSACALQFLIKSITSPAGKSRTEYASLKLITALTMLLFFFLIDPTHENCFRLIGLLQFSVGSINFCSFVYDKVSRIY